MNAFGCRSVSLGGVSRSGLGPYPRYMYSSRSGGCHALLWFDAQNFNAKERHFILPLVIRTFIMLSVAFISSILQVHIKLIFFALIDHTYLRSNVLLHAPMTTYLKDLTQSIGRYGGLSWQNWV